MIHKVISTIEHYHMLKKGTTVIVAISGGADSMALLSILRSLSNDYNLRLIAAHVNHLLRGDEAGRDEEFVKDYCKTMNIELKILNADIKKFASLAGEGIEECGRRIRYEFFNSICSNAVIATAHTFSDSIETILFNLARGAVLKGICGIPAVRDNIIRPLIDCSRAEIEEYCGIHSIPFITDSTNFEDKYMRNHIRINIIPQFKKINPSFNDAFHRFSESLKADEDLLKQLSQELYEKSKEEKGFDAGMLLESHVALRKRVLSFILYEKTGIASQNKHIEAVTNLLLTGGIIQVQKGIMVAVNNGVLFFPDDEEDVVSWGFDFREGTLDLPYETAKIIIVNKKDLENIQNIHKNILDNCFDYDKIIGNAVLRNRREGDRIRLSKRNCTKTLKKLFNEKSIPVKERKKVLFAADSEGLLWVDGIGVAQRCEISEETKKIAVIILRRSKFA